ncbi:hypothetical protein D9613_011673 [Agrocybe pediades]|uniref:Uncharacterized protein n=1 Tax=Agrocybe pediades TaxID=84607 RepID=A0A8H4QXM3_9AGAR|nr:hypothetical protein D9613_011673 [Agrocybe pediades]KAF9551407.1 hypothetical protein CPC08DRAFT_729026 [Agrocybe pediades]
MVKVATSVFIAALIAAPAFASANWEDIDARELSEQSIFGRDVVEADSMYSRELDELYTRVTEELEARGFDSEVHELVARNKIKNFFKKIWHGIKKVASVILRREDGTEEEVFSRDDMDIEARDIDELVERFISEIDERSPGFLEYMNEPETREFSDHFELSERDFSDELEVYEREFNEDADLLERDFEEELQEREFEIDELD